jgi:hypothetical protein
LPRRLGTVAVSVVLLAFALGGVFSSTSNLREAGAQEVTVPTLTVTVPVNRTVIQTVTETVQMPVTSNRTVTSVATTWSYVTVRQSVTEWNTITSVTTAMGILGALPSRIFGLYSDLALIVVGVLGGVAVALASSRVFWKRAKPASLQGEEDAGKPDEIEGTGLVETGLSFPKDHFGISSVASHPDFDAVMAEHDRIGRLLPPTTKIKADGIAKTLLDEKPPDLYHAATSEVRKRFSSWAEWDRSGVDIVSFYVIGEILEDFMDSTGDESQLVSVDLQDAMQKEQQVIATLSEILKKTGDTQKEIIESLDGD